MKERIHSIDIVRGLIMIIMTLDHSRDLLHLPGASPLDMATTTPALFFTRWVTHFCAPTFVFLSGVSAYLAGQRRTKKQMTFFLLSRGAWLIVSDLLFITLLFTFDIQYHFLVLEVLFAIGAGMIILALLLRAHLGVITTIALLLFFGHNLLDYVTLPSNGFIGGLVKLFLSVKGLFIPISEERNIIVLYAILPWTSALLLGYVFGALYQKGFAVKKRRNILLASGFTLIAMFILLRFINQYGDPSPWMIQRNNTLTLLSFLNTTKQSPSLLFFCMTLGPILVLLSLIENTNNKVTNFFRVYGNVPYFYFTIHFCLLRILHVSLALIMGLPLKSDGSPIVWQVLGFGLSLGQVYICWIGIVITLYFVCRWYGHYKRTHNYWWLSFV